MDDKKLLMHCIIPVNKHISKKNRKVIRKKFNGQRFIGSVSSFKKEELLYISFIKSSMHKYSNEYPLRCPLHLKALFYYKNTSNDQKWKRVIDLSNLLQAPEDCLEKAGCILNDKLIESYDGSRRIYGHSSFLVELFLYRFIE